MKDLSEMGPVLRKFAVPWPQHQQPSVNVGGCGLEEELGPCRVAWGLHWFRKQVVSHFCPEVLHFLHDCGGRAGG